MTAPPTPLPTLLPTYIPLTSLNLHPASFDDDERARESFFVLS